MKAGVSISPWAVRRRPRRAPPSAFNRSKPNDAMRSGRREVRVASVSDDEHGIAVRIEAVSRADGMTIGGQQTLPAAQGRHQEEQGRAREMEVGDQRVDRLERVSRVD